MMRRMEHDGARCRDGRGDERRPWSRGYGWLPLVLALLAAGCIGGSPTMAQTPQPGGDEAGGSGSGGGGSGGSDELEVPDIEPPSDMAVIDLDAETWSELRPHFEEYVDKRHTAPKDAFKPQVLNIIPRPKIEEAEKKAGEEDTDGPSRPTGPLQKYDLSEYRLQLIMSGTAVPKAVVEDPQEETYIVQPGARIGKDGGIVESITQYYVIVQKPNVQEPERLSLRPAYIGGPGASGPEGKDESGRTAGQVVEPLHETQ